MKNIVVGLYRSGTTALVKALETGGLEAVLPDACPCLDEAYPLSEARRKRCQWQHEPRTRVREPTHEQFHQFGFPAMYPDECVIKMLWPGVAPALSSMCYALSPSTEGYRVVWIWRHPWEIRVSFEEMDWSRGDGQRTHTSAPWMTQGDNYREAMGMMRAHYLNRRDVRSFTEIQYAPNYRADLPALLGDQAEIFRTLADEGWPIDPMAAAREIDPSRRRHFAEDIPPERVA